MKQNYNKKSLALLGHGKWKSALGHTLLLIGMVLMGGVATAQNLTPIPTGLKMEKKWQSDDPTGRTGNILVEAFVTGHSVAQHVPTDIVLVLDVSGSMSENMPTTYVYNPRPSQTYTYNGYGNSNYYYYYNGQYYQVSRERTGGMFNRRYNLHFSTGTTTWYLTDNVEGGLTTDINQASVTGNLLGNSDEPIWTGVLYQLQAVTPTRLQALQEAVCQFVDIIAEDATTYNVDHRISIVKYAMNRYYGDDEESIAEGDHSYRYSNNLTNANYTEVVIARRDPRTQANYIKTQVNNLHSGGATASDFGMSKARFVLASIPAAEFEERSKVVVMFTDGAPTYGNAFDSDVATSTIGNAYDLKHSWTYNNNTYQFDASVFSVGVFDNETTNIRTYMNRVSSNYPDATGMGTNQGGTQASDDYYFTAESAGGLADIFEAIAGASGAMSLPASAIVQDMVSPNFQLPEGASGTIIAYAPLCTNYNEVTGEYTFEDINDAGTLTIGQVPDPENPGQYITGVVTSTAAANENMLPANFVSVNGKTIQMSGFNFSYHWCGWIEDEHGDKTINGRKIVIKIPVEVEEGMWGDGIETNNPDQSYIQVGDIYYGPFNNLTTNVMGDVWTEVVTTEPDDFDPMNIDSPEDLAWFISKVNGRIHYNGNTNNVASNTSLNGKLTADIDMSAHNWVPIGSGYMCNDQNQYIDANGNVVNQPTVKLAYEGIFDGNGHVITGLKNNADRWYKTAAGQQNEVVVFPGMFANVKGTVHDVFILDSDFRGKYHGGDYEGKFIHHGILADTLTGGTIYNCEAAGSMTCNNDAPGDVNLIYGGLVGLNDDGTIYNAMAMANLTGYTMGGAVGENRGGSFKNGFTNGVYKYLGADDTYKVGGLAATNTGTIDNCYVRFERLTNENLDKANFDMLVGSGTSATHSYTPQIWTYSRPSVTSITTWLNLNASIPIPTAEAGTSTDDSYTLSVSPSFYNMFTNDNMTGGHWGTLGSFNVYEEGTPLLDMLNENKGTGATWKRTTAGAYSANAGNINGDYPVLQLDGYTCLASTDGITIDYAHNLSDMLHRHNNGNMNENTNIDNEYTDANEDYYKVSGHAAIYKGTINLYANDDVTLQTTGGKDDETVADNCTAQGVVVYIDENISLLQDASSTIEAYTGQTLKAFDNTELQAGERWHNISSSLSNSIFGWSYGTEEQVAHNWDSDPCGWDLNNHDEDYAFFPIDLSSYHRADFYCFYEPQYHWINFRRNSLSHWHMDDYEVNIPYNNEDHFIPGKGYLTTVDMSTWWAYNLNDNTISKQAQFMQNRGTLNKGNVNIDVTYTPTATYDLHGYKTGLEGYNLLGNPYQSYLDFDEFVEVNSDLLANSKFANTYAVYDPSQGNYVQYMSGSSKGSRAAGQYLNMHQGFFIQVNTSGTATFTNDMRSNDGTPNFRGEQPAYPLINFIVTDKDGNTDLAILEVNRRENDGAKKLRVGNATGRIFFRYNDEKLAIFFRDNAEGYQSLNFDASENGNFTLNWERANDNFSSLTLIDNITGVKTDMLTHDHYTFEGRIDDYTSRFKIVFGTLTDEDEEEPSIENFAFFNNGDLIVNGEGRLDIIDVLGRVLYSAELTDTQNTVNLPQNAKGVCMIRLTKGDNVKVQKFFVR